MINVEHGARVVSFWDDPSAAAATAIRRTLRAVFARWHLDDETAADALIVVEEMVANVVDHARTPFRLVVRLDGAVLHIAVHDHCPQPLRIQTLDPERLRGRGLLMIAAIATQWGSISDDTGKTVWADLPA
ncbi:ATP-binding protein [Pseudonocardia charpentierae]|uniref:ATP-binding protein n=1 Tax=Pseudonocardia charpentierae TaxID=3075545 RepID=A0ABU2NDG7_9PSEU|nr:ATP-binding protein [Pseudonocardia sp. DSM 45834]MDT0351642.1 ATP-binding protein [Pseudonocardia sp. DSM 45834]